MAETTEEIIRERAAQGWSRAQVAESLGIDRKKMRAMTSVMGTIPWPARNMSLRRQAYYDSIRTRAAQ